MTTVRQSANPVKKTIIRLEIRIVGVFIKVDVNPLLFLEVVSLLLHKVDCRDTIGS